MQSLGNNWATPPGAEEIEVSVFGPGYGECIVVHVGLGDWIIIDSCLEPEEKEPVALAYLAGLGVDHAAAVKAVIASHWDDDHIRGLAKVVEECKGATFSCSDALTSEEFAAVIANWSDATGNPGGSGVDELEKILKILKNRFGGRNRTYPCPKYAISGRTIFEREGQAPVRVTALAPSDAASTIAKLAFSDIVRKAIERHGQFTRRLPRIEGNHASCVIAVRIDGERLLLGGDLQVRAERTLGWLAIVDEQRDQQKHVVYKMPHHGSHNGDHDEIWQHLLIADPWVAVTPFSQGATKLPTPNDCARILDRSANSYLTASPNPQKIRGISNRLDKALKNNSKQIQIVHSRFGQVRFRRRFDATMWAAELFGDAKTIKQHLAENPARNP